MISGFVLAITWDPARGGFYLAGRPILSGWLTPAPPFGT
jgi:hypothetical protein